MIRRRAPVSGRGHLLADRPMPGVIGLHAVVFASDRHDLVLEPHGVSKKVQVKRRSLVTEDVAQRLLRQAAPDSVLLVIADRVTDGARKVLMSRRSGYLDLRGRLALRTDRVVIDAEVEPVSGRTERAGALSGKAGLEVAVALLMQPERGVPDQTLIRRAITLLGVADSTSQARATVRVAPVPAVVRQRVDLDSSPLEWPLAHPLFVALDLAQDVGRGREILDAWTLDDRWTRVW